jgi:hypothetical protein
MSSQSLKDVISCDVPCRLHYTDIDIETVCVMGPITCHSGRK